MRIQLDSSALAYLIENSTEGFKLELQSAVIQKFAEKYLKSLVTAEAMQEAQSNVLDAIAAMKNEVQKQVDESIGRVRIDYYSGRKEFVSINGDVSEELRAIASAQREAAVTSLASQMPRITEKKILNMLTDEYKEQIRETVRQEVSTEMLAKLK
jgi:hypothetical protein